MTSVSKWRLQSQKSYGLNIFIDSLGISKCWETLYHTRSPFSAHFKPRLCYQGVKIVSEVVVSHTEQGKSSVISWPLLYWFRSEKQVKIWYNDTWFFYNQIQGVPKILIQFRRQAAPLLWRYIKYRVIVSVTPDMLLKTLEELDYRFDVYLVTRRAHIWTL